MTCDLRIKPPMPIIKPPIFSRFNFFYAGSFAYFEAFISFFVLYRTSTLPPCVTPVPTYKIIDYVFRRHYQDAHFMPIVGVGKRGAQ